MPDTRENLARYAHQAWAGWMEYLFSKGEMTPDGTCTLPSWAVNRWYRQANTPYGSLSEAEKESDRAEADKILAIIASDPVEAT